MFTTALYPARPDIRLVWDGSNTQTGQPAALEMASGRAYIEAGTLIDPTGAEITLLPEEQAALLLTGAGFDELSTQNRIEKWFRNPEGSVVSMQKKLGATALLAGEAAIANAFERGFLIEDEHADLNFINRTNRWDFLQTVRLLGSNRPITEICEALKKSVDEVLTIVHAVSEDMAFEAMERPGQALVMLAGMNGMLPSYAGITTLRNLLFTPRDNPLPQFFPPQDSAKSIWMNPFDDDPYTLVRFSGQPGDQKEATPYTGAVDRIRIRNAIVDVHNPIVNERTGQRRFAPRELAAFVFRCIGMGSEEAAARTAHAGKGDVTRLWRVYDELLPDREAAKRSRFAEMAIRVAFREGIFTRRREPDLHGIDKLECERLKIISDGFAEGKSIAEVGESFKESIFQKKRSAASISADLRGLTDMLEVRNAVALTFVSEANNPEYPLIPLDPNEDAGMAA